MANTARRAGPSNHNGSLPDRAPYHRHDPPFKEDYIILFKEGHTLTQHFAFLGNELEIEGELNEGYLAKLDGETFEAVRQDPGVRLVEDNTLAEWGPSDEELEQAAREEAAKANTSAYQAPYQRNNGADENHYIVAFKPDHTLAKHFAFVGKEFKIDGRLDEGYYGGLDLELFEDVRRDPGVEMIEDNTLGDSFETYDPSGRWLPEAVEEERARRGG